MVKRLQWHLTYCACCLFLQNADPNTTNFKFHRLYMKVARTPINAVFAVNCQISNSQTHRYMLCSTLFLSVLRFSEVWCTELYFCCSLLWVWCRSTHQYCKLLCTFAKFANITATTDKMMCRYSLWMWCMLLALFPLWIQCVNFNSLIWTLFLSQSAACCMLLYWEGKQPYLGQTTDVDVC